MADKPADSKKVMDVSTKSSAPSSTSRPVILNNRKIVQDPMMKPDNSDESVASGEPVKKPRTMASTGKTLQPLNTEADTKEEKPTEATTPEPEGEKPTDDSPEPEKTTEAEENDKDEVDEEARKAKEEAAIVDAVASQAGGKKKTEDEIKTDSAKQEAIAKLIEEKKYFLPIGEITKRKHNKQLVLVAAFMAVAVVGGYIALDMEIVDSSVKLPIEFFK